MKNSKKLTIHLILLVAVLEFVSSMPQESWSSQVLPRHQRQIIANELGSGLTGTGTSFQSSFGGYNNYDYPTYAQQQALIDYDYNEQSGKTGYNRPLVPPATIGTSYGGAGGYIRGSGGYLQDEGVGNWRGFGRGRYANRGKLGVKY